VVSNAGLAHDGDKFLQATGTVAGASFFQDFGLASASGQPLAVSGWFRAGSATPVSGTFCGWQLGSVWTPSCTGFTVTNAAWTRVSTVAQTSESKALGRVQVYLGTLNAPLLTDTVTAVRTGDVPGTGAPVYPPNNIAPVYSGEAVFGSWFGAKQYSRLRFDLPASLTGASVNSAVLHSFVKNCDARTPTGGVAPQYSYPIHVRRLVADFDTTPEAVQGDRAVLPPGAAAYADADVTDFVKGWAADPGSNFGVRLDMADTAGNDAYCKVLSRTGETSLAGDPNKTTWLEVTYNEAPAATKRFHPVTPVTVFNSSSGVGTPSTGGVGYQSGRSVTVVGGVTGVPTSGVSAVSVSVTGTNRKPTDMGAVKVYPAGPSLFASVETDWPAGALSVAANQAVVPIGQGNQITAEVFAGQGDVQLDITGWFDDGTAATAAGGLRYQPQVGERIADTRYGFGGPLVANVTRPFAVLGQGGVPGVGVGAVAVQVHAIGSGPSRIKVWATGDAEPADTAALVLGTGADQRSALMFVKIGAGGAINMKSSSAATNVLDAMGYFVTSATAGAGFQPVTPQRIYDSRAAVNGAAPINDTDIRVSDGAGVGAVLVNVIAFQPAGAATVDVYPSGEAHDNFDTALVVGSGQLATSSLAFVRPSGDGRIHVNVWPVSAHIIVDLVGYTGTADTVGLSAGNQITNGSFEVGNASWFTNTACGDAAGAVSFTTVTSASNPAFPADDGNTYARVVSASPTATGSFCQNVNRSLNPPRAQELYTLNFRVRSAPSQPAGRGALELWELVAPPGTDTASVKQQLITTPTWTEKSLSMCAARNSSSTLRVKVYPYGTNPIDVDNVRLTSSTSQACQPVDSFPSTADLNLVPAAPASNLPGGSFDFLEERWGNCRSSSARYRNEPATGFANFQQRSAQAYGSRGGYMATNVSAVDGNRLCRNFLGAPINSNNTPQTFTVWVRSEDGSLVDSAIEISGHIRQFDWQCGSGADVSGCGGSWPFTVDQKVTATNLWKKVTVTWWPPNLDQGAGTYPDTFSIAVRPLVTGKTILFDEATQVGPFGPNSCSSWSYQGCRSPGGTTPGGAGGVTQDPVYPALSDGIPGQLHDPAFTSCLSLSSADAVAMASTATPTDCTFFIPHLVASGIMISDGIDSCLTRLGVSLVLAPCSGAETQVFQDRLLNSTADFFTIQNAGQCLQYSPVLSFISCVDGNQAQIWADARKLPGVNVAVYSTGPYGMGGNGLNPPIVSNPPTPPVSIGLANRQSRGFIEPFCLYNGGYCQAISSLKIRQEASVQTLALRRLAKQVSLGRTMWQVATNASINGTGIEWETTVPASSGVPLRRADITKSLNVNTSTPAGIVQFTPFDVYEVKYIDDGQVVTNYIGAIGQLEDYTASGPFASVAGLLPVMPGARRGGQLAGWIGAIDRSGSPPICVWGAGGGKVESWTRSWPGATYSGNADGKGVVIGTPITNVSRSQWNSVRGPGDLFESEILQKCQTQS
jgi:hypothetical protein